jgi:hypothetical protein
LSQTLRGSRHAWDIRLISAEALMKLVALKENSDEPETGGKIRGVLAPVEYTRLDGLVDVVFTTATDLEADLTDNLPSEVGNSQEIPPPTPDESTTHEMTDGRLLQIKREAIVTAMSSKLGETLVRKSRALYQSPDHKKRIACTIPKRYSAGSTYWYAYHPKWDDFLKDGSEGYFVLGCMDLDRAFALPRRFIYDLLDNLHVSETQNSRYWHIHINERRSSEFELVIPRKQNLSLREYEVGIPPS